jgi:hypothetical protein
MRRYEKKQGKESPWYHFIKELDTLRARGQQEVESPLLWEEEELQRLLKGSPFLAEVLARKEGIKKEWEASDDVWFLAGSLFK